ncbi:MAG: arginine deiminase family protein [Bacteroidota bacterium]
MKFGCQSMVKPIRSLLLSHPRDAFASNQSIDAQWKSLRYSGRPDYEKAVDEYERFLELLPESVGEIYFLPRQNETGLDAIYVHDPVIVSNKGAILCKMGKDQRRHEPAAAGEFLKQIGVPILGAITGDGKLEGGDVVWFDDRTLAVGRGYRTNDEGIVQLKHLLEDAVNEVTVVPLPHWKGPNDVMHLMSLLSLIDDNLAVVYSRLLPVHFREWLLSRGIRLLEIPDSEFQTMACNVLAVGPRKCIMLSGNPQTRSMLENEGVDVRVYDGEEISFKGAGGPTCLTRPIFRQ